MNTQTLIFILTLMGLAIVAALIFLAVAGYAVAYIALTVLGTVFLIVLGLSFGLIHQKIAQDRQQSAFLDNAQENLGIMSAMQSIQNKQNSTLLQQLGSVSKLPQAPVENGHNAFMIEDGIFDELD